MFMYYNGTESINAEVLSQCKHVSLLLYILVPVILLLDPLPPYANTHVYTHFSPMVHIDTLALRPLVQSFEEPPPTAADSISFALIISHKRCVWL